MFSAIVSSKNPKVKHAVQLRESKWRRREALFLIDGFREVLRAWHSPFELVAIFWNAGENIVADQQVDVKSALVQAGFPCERLAEFYKFLMDADSQKIPVVPLATQAFEKISFGNRNEGVVAVARSRHYSLTQLNETLRTRRDRTGEEPLVAVLEGVEKPGNIGAILRSADGAGVDALIIVADDYDVFNPSAIRTSLGAIFHVPIVVAPVEKVLGWLREKKFQRATALCDESISYAQLDYRRPTAVILGSEAEGLTPVWSQETSTDMKFELLKKIRIPMLGVADSLNVSNAAAILFYEARRVRQNQ
ncbi:MAG: TrmH family RNA methyltransferase [Thermoguttaceae bacterium]|jgi:TrmH family RNA methyltransferase